MIFKQNGYSDYQIKKCLPKQNKTTKQDTKIHQTRLVVVLLYDQETDKIGGIFRKHNIKTVFKPYLTLLTIVRNPKGKAPLEPAFLANTVKNIDKS